MSYISFYDDGELRAYLFEQGLNFIQASLFMLLQSIDKYAQQNGNQTGVKISNSKLAKELGITQRSVTTHLSKLQELGFIKISFDRSNSTNTKRYIKPVKLVKFGIESQISGIIGYINKLLNSTLDNLDELDNTDLETRNQIKQAILHFGSDTALINYINSHNDEFTNYENVQDWLLDFSTP